jgi:hypothetical protein
MIYRVEEEAVAAAARFDASTRAALVAHDHWGRQARRLALQTSK